MLDRRGFLRASLAAAGGLALARPMRTARATHTWTARESKLFPGSFVAHADLHNHSLHSDGAGDPALAFGLMRDAGLDVAALTDHSTLSWGAPQNFCPESGCQSVAGINEQTWAEAASLAAGATIPHEFVALRGFEWSSPTIGHMNVWFSDRWMDPLHTGGGGTGEGAAQFAHDEAGVPAEQMAILDAMVRDAPSTGVGMAAFYRWLELPPATPLVGGGSEGLAQFNHPGREPGRFSHFRRLGLPAPSNVIGIEMFNRREDYFFEGTESIAQSPLNECLNAGWRVGISGVTDEHDPDWGTPLGKGRTGLWVEELTGPGVRAALANRRFFATRERGLRVDAKANGVRMGGELAHTTGDIHFVLDFAGYAAPGTPLRVQILRSGDRMPAIQDEITFPIPGELDPPVEFTRAVDIADGDWIVLRITDPAAPPDGRATGAYASAGNGLAYCSPFYLNG